MFCIQNKKKFSFWVDLWSQKVCDPVTECLIFRKRGVKISVRLQEKSQEVAWLQALQFSVRDKNLSRGALRAPPSPSAVRVKVLTIMEFKKVRAEKYSIINKRMEITDK